jgi:hypothetical protein
VRPREKLRKIEALFACAAAPGEKAAADVAADRSRARLVLPPATSSGENQILDARHRLRHRARRD